VLESLSRTMPFVVDDRQIQWARDIRELLAAYSDIEDLVSIGAYKEGTKPLADKAIKAWGPINEFLRQDKADGTPMGETLRRMEEIFREEV